MTVTLYGIPTCGTVKKARKWLDEHGVDNEFVDFREHPVDPARVSAWADALGARALRNTSGGAWRALGPDKKDWSDARLTQALQGDPMLIKRPIVELDGRPVAVGFRAERFAELFGG